MPGAPERPAEATPAGFWQRTAAWTLDAAVVAAPAYWLARGAVDAARPAWHAFADALEAALAPALRRVLDGATPLEAATGLLADPSLSTAADALRAALVQGLVPPLCAFVPLALVWHVGFERSRWQASPGKRALGLRVVAASGGRPAAWRSVWRFLAGAASWLSLNLGHALAALPPRHLTLHDRLSETRVLARRAGLPGWAKAWLLLLALLLLAANAWLLLALDAAMQAALERALRA